MYMSTVFGCFGIDIVSMFAHVLNNCYVFVFAMYPPGYRISCLHYVSITCI